VDTKKGCWRKDAQLDSSAERPGQVHAANRGESLANYEGGGGLSKSPAGRTLHPFKTSGVFKRGTRLLEMGKKRPKTRKNPQERGGGVDACFASWKAYVGASQPRAD